MLRLLKRKFRPSPGGEIFHFSRILKQRAKRWKYAKYEGLFYGKIPMGMGLCGQKFLSGKNVVLEKKPSKKDYFLVKYKEN